MLIDTDERFDGLPHSLGVILIISKVVLKNSDLALLTRKTALFRAPL